MKIYGNYTFLLDKLNVRSNTQVQDFQNGMKIVQFADDFLKEQRAASQDAVSISREGIDYMRDQMSDLSASAGYSQFPEGGLSRFAGNGLSLMDGLCRTYILQRLDSNGANGVSSRLYSEMADKYRKKLSASEAQDMSARAGALVDVHAVMCEKIREGYENDTREVWIQDASTGEDFSGVEFEIDGHAVRYRKLSREEELDNLGKTYDKLVEDVAEQIAKDATESIQKDGGEEDGAAGELWQLSGMAADILKELKSLIAETEAEEAEKKREEEAEDLNAGERMETEWKNRSMEAATRGMRRVQYANYKKMSQMTSDEQVLLGNVRA